MIGNEYLHELCHYPDRDASLNQLLELLERTDRVFIESLNVPVDLDKCTEDELHYLTIASALIDHLLQKKSLPVPTWLRDQRLAFAKPFYYSTRISDFEKVRLLFTSPGPFQARNVFFDLAGISRV